MSTYSVGQQPRLTETFKASDGTPTNPTTVTLTIVAPDGTTITPSATAEGSGVYHYDLLLTQGGTWRYRFTGTGTVVASSGWQTLYVRHPAGVAT